MRCLAAGAFAKAIAAGGDAPCPSDACPQASQKRVGVSVKRVFNPRLQAEPGRRLGGHAEVRKNERGAIAGGGAGAFFYFKTKVREKS